MNAKLYGQLRELLAAGGVALVQFGFVTGELWQQISGALLALVALVSALSRHKDAYGKLETSMRKFLSSIGGLAMSFGLVTEDQTTALIGVGSLLAAMLWSWFEKGKGRGK